VDAGRLHHNADLAGGRLRIVDCLVPQVLRGPELVLADGMQVLGASLKNGLLSVDLIRPEPDKMVKKINISVSQ